ncbi:MAG: hypothetical protein LAP87_08385 [Acidobacteriia bacterium]|nr:hypothetical protein [Terriglobia bacterium]
MARTQLDKFIETPEIKPIVEKYFVFARLTVQEHEGETSLNSPGGDEVLAKTGGKDSGLPFFAFLDAKGGTIVNSRRQPGGANIGHPYAPEEIDWFLAMVKKAAPGIARDEAATLERYLRSQKQ